MWDKCRQCKQKYHGVVACALGWACWKTYLGRPETDQIQQLAMSVLGNGLYDGKHYEDALLVDEARLSLLRRLGAPEEDMLVAKSCLASTYNDLGRQQDSLRMSRDVYSGRLKLYGEEHESTLREANNYALSLLGLKGFKEARSVLRKMMPIARRVLGEGDRLTLKMRWNYATALCNNTVTGATLDDLREAVTTFEEVERIARRVFGDAYPLLGKGSEDNLRRARAALRARETPGGA